MTDRRIIYKSGFKHQLVSNYYIEIPIKPLIEFETAYIKLETNGQLTIKAGYAWDGASGPVRDTKEVLRASLVHDALYQLMRTFPKNFSRNIYRDKADLIFRNICIEDGVREYKAEIYYIGLKKFGKSSASPKNKKRIKKAPNKK